jgi:hypothetical protein
MTRVFSGLGSGGHPTRRAKPRRRVAPEVAPLEGRLLQYFSVTAAVTPSTLWPPNGLYDPVTVSGTFKEYAIVGTGAKAHIVYEKLPGPKKAHFFVTDEYRRDEPEGPITLVDLGGGQYGFSFTVHLQAKRATEYVAGRRYYVTVEANDTENGWGGQTYPVQVPTSLANRGPRPLPTLHPKHKPKGKPHPPSSSSSSSTSSLQFL